MSSAWLLPEHIADVLPVEARCTEELRRKLLDRAQAYGYELIAPPLLEHLESLFSDAGSGLDLRTFKLVDQLSGRMLGLRADTTIQAARIDAHLLNREGTTRLCYCGPVLHTRPSAPYATREPLQFGAEVFGHAGLEADLEVLELAVDCLQLAGAVNPVLDLADARILRGVLAGVPLDGQALTQIVEALARKDAAGLAARSADMPGATREALGVLLGLYGGDEVLAAAREQLPARALVQESIQQLAWLGSQLQAAHPAVRVGFDLSDMSGYAYYSGPRFAVYGVGATEALARGGRYDEVGAAFGRNRPAAGFSLDLKVLAAMGNMAPAAAAISAPWGDAPGLKMAVRALRDAGEIVVCMAPGAAVEAAGFCCDRKLVHADGRWLVQARATHPE